MHLKEKDYVNNEKNVEGRGTHPIEQKQTQTTVADVRTNNRKLTEGKSVLGIVGVKQGSLSLLET